MKIKEFKTNVKEILETANISELLVGKRESFVGAKETAIKIMLMAGMSKRIALSAVYGVQNNPKCNTSCYLLDEWNFCTMYDGYCLQYCIELATKFIEENQQCEVGMKYPEFEPLFLVQKYGLSKTGIFEPNWSKKDLDRKASERTYYELWQNEDKSVSFSFEKGRMGKGGYAGATFDTFEKAISFVEWFFKSPTNYLKDCDLFINRLGGLSSNEVSEINKSQLITI